jgi:hypothetical protein
MATSLKDWNDGKGGEWRDFLSEFYRASDREAVILGGAFLDEHLRILLQQLNIADPTERVTLAKLDNPKAWFSARVDAARRNYLLGDGEVQDLRVIATIRNAFAHSLHGLSFDEPLVVAECAKLKAPSTDQNAGAVQTARERFDLTVVLLAEQISFRAMKAMKGDRTPSTDYSIAKWFWSNRQKPIVTFQPKGQDQTHGAPPSDTGQ